jgi:uncharacterized membrane-anchored protein YhcB (DUF1043 family)
MKDKLQNQDYFDNIKKKLAEYKKELKKEFAAIREIIKKEETE